MARDTLPTLRLSTLNPAPRIEIAPFELASLDPGRIPVKWHGTGACHGLFIPETCTENGQFRVVVLRLARFACLSQAAAADVAVVFVSTSSSEGSERACVAAYRLATHAKNEFAGRCIPFLVLGFWDKNTGICAGAMPNARILQPQPGARYFKLNKA